MRGLQNIDLFVMFNGGSKFSVGKGELIALGFSMIYRYFFLRPKWSVKPKKTPIDVVKQVQSRN